MCKEGSKEAFSMIEGRTGSYLFLNIKISINSSLYQTLKSPVLTRSSDMTSYLDILLHFMFYGYSFPYYSASSYGVMKI